MPTVTAADLAAARAEGRAIGSFTAYGPETALALRDAAEATGLPVIVQVGAGTFRHTDRATLVALLRAATAGSPARLGVHLDHSRELDEVAACLELGCSSVMFDGSHLPFEENCEATRQAVALGRRAGAWVEGELGAVPGEEDRSTAVAGPAELTDPGQAAEFAERTGVDALAVQVGNVHGFGGDGRLDLDRLAAIAAAVPVPLVLHGASGLPGPVLRAAIARGVAKVNVNAELRRAALTAFGTALPAAREDGENLQALLTAGREAVAAAAAAKARLFGLPGR